MQAGHGRFGDTVEREGRIEVATDRRLAVVAVDDQHPQSGVAQGGGHVGDGGRLAVTGVGRGDEDHRRPPGFGDRSCGGAVEGEVPPDGELDRGAQGPVALGGGRAGRVDDDERSDRPFLDREHGHLDEDRETGHRLHPVAAAEAIVPGLDQEGGEEAEHEAGGEPDGDAGGVRHGGAGAEVGLAIGGRGRDPRHDGGAAPGFPVGLEAIVVRLRVDLHRCGGLQGGEAAGGGALRGEGLQLPVGGGVVRLDLIELGLEGGVRGSAASLASRSERCAFNWSSWRRT